MPNYHFNLSNGTREVDVEGTELPGLHEARRQAVVFAGAHLSDHPELIWDGERFVVEFTDDDGKRVFSVEIEAHLHS